jgi:hypothetical protein
MRVTVARAEGGQEMLPSLLIEQVHEAQIADRRREVEALQRGLLAARITKQVRRDNHRWVPVRTGKASVPAACSEC